MQRVHIEQIRQELTWSLRQNVLYPDKPVTDMGLPEDAYGTHFGAFTQDKLVGVVSVFQNGADFQFRKFAIARQFQQSGIGKQLLHYIIHHIRTEGGTRLWCNARLSATGFYMRYGFVKTGEIFERNDIEYVIMERQWVDKE